MNKKKRRHIIKALAFMVFITIIMFSITNCSTTAKLMRETDRKFKWFGDFEYRIIDDDSVEITNYKGSSKIVNIPEKIKDKKVIKISFGAFNDEGLTSVTIPDSVIEIYGTTLEKKDVDKNYGAFSNNKLSNINIPDSVTKIGDFSFKDNQLTSITIPENVTNIGDYAFANNQLTSITIPENVTYIGKYAFANNQLTRITIHNKIKEIGFSAFGNSIHGLLKMYGIRAGTFEKRDDKWYFNGTALTEPARLILQYDHDKGNIYIAQIDGKAAGSLPASISTKMPAGSTMGDVYLTPGLHTITIGWFKGSKSGWSYSEGQVTFEYVYTFESAEYDITGEEQGYQILFSIKRRN